MNLLEKNKLREDFGSLLTELHRLIDVGQGDSMKADDQREKMEVTWSLFSEEDARHFQLTSAKRNREREIVEPQGILSSSVRITGTIKVKRPLMIDGIIDGTINSEGMITIGSNGDVHGDINCKNAVVFGKVYGNIKAERCELRANSSLHGDIKVAQIIIEEGASFIGNTEMRLPVSVAEKPSLISQNVARPLTKSAAT